jgi:hypothetical protein
MERLAWVLHTGYIATLIACGVDPRPPTEPRPHGPLDPLAQPGEHQPAASGFNATDPSIAFDGLNYLVVWSDARDGKDYDVWGARLDSSGAILDRTSFPIAKSPGIQSRPVVTFDGTRYLVVWEDFKFMNGVESDLDAALVTVDAEVTRIGRIATSSASEILPSIASNGVTTFATWTAGNQLQGALFDGTTFGVPFEITPADVPHRDSAIAAIPSGDYLVAFTAISPTTADDIRGQRVTSSGALAGSIIDISTSMVPTRNPSVAFDGENFVVVFSNYYTGVDIYGTRVTPSGDILDTHREGENVVGGTLINEDINYQETPSISCRNSDCLVAWQDKRNLAATSFDVYAQRLGPALTPDGPVIAVSTAPLSQLQPRVLGAGDEYMVVWRDARAGQNSALRIGSTRITAQGVADPDGVVVSRGRVSEQGPTLVHAGQWLALAWSDSRGLWGDDLKLSRLNDAAERLDVYALPVSGAPFAQAEIATASVGDDLVSVWSDNRNGFDTDLYMTRMNLEGALIDGENLISPIEPGQDVAPKIVSSATGALVVWLRVRGESKDIHGALIDASGQVSAPFVICGASGEQGHPVAVFDPESNQYVVAWQDRRSGTFDIYASRVTTNGVVLDADGVRVTTNSASQHSPRIANIGRKLIIVYQDQRNGNWDIYATRLVLEEALTVVEPDIAVTSDPAPQSAPNVATDGVGFVVTWNDERDVLVNKIDVWARAIDHNGIPLATEIPIAASLDDESGSSIVSVRLGHFIVAYSRRRLDIHAMQAVTVPLEITTF